MGFSDRLRAWLRGDAKRAQTNKSTDRSSRASTKDLEEFVASRVGVEAFLEPKTAIYSTTVLLVADDGEYLRRPVKDKDHAREFAAKVNIPLYDARKVGYPKRMRDYDQGKRPRRVDLSELPPWPGDESGPAAVDGPPPPPPMRRTTDSSSPGSAAMPEAPGPEDAAGRSEDVARDEGERADDVREHDDDGRDADGRNADGRDADGRNADGRNADGRNADGRNDAPPNSP